MKNVPKLKGDAVKVFVLCRAMTKMNDLSFTKPKNVGTRIKDLIYGIGIKDGVKGYQLT